MTYLGPNLAFHPVEADRSPFPHGTFGSSWKTIVPCERTFLRSHLDPCLPLRMVLSHSVNRSCVDFLFLPQSGHGLLRIYRGLQNGHALRICPLLDRHVLQSGRRLFPESRVVVAKTLPETELHSSYCTPTCVVDFLQYCCWLRCCVSLYCEECCFLRGLPHRPPYRPRPPTDCDQSLRACLGPNHQIART